MRYIECSEYLRQQEQALRHKAHEAQAVRLAPPGIWCALAWVLSGQRAHARAARDERVRTLLREASYYRQGIAGEDVLRRSLARQLDNHFILVSGYTPPPPWHLGGDIDAVLVGTHGITVFEAKAWQDYFRCAGDTWWYRSHPRQSWQPAQGNPTAQARANAERVARTLQARGIANIRVQPMVAIASESMHVLLDRQNPPQVYLYFAQSPNTAFDQREHRPVLSEAQVEQAWRALVEPAQ
ncbi:MAG TPA: nuclease-related domain-containing protein [Ktedonobacterales bacterium]|jgi:hypothetical protein